MISNCKKWMDLYSKLGLLRYTANTAYRGICGCGKNTVPYRNNASRAVFSPFSRGRIPQIPHTAVFAVAVKIPHPYRNSALSHAVFPFTRGWIPHVRYLRYMRYMQYLRYMRYLRYYRIAVLLYLRYTADAVMRYLRYFFKIM